MGLFDKFKKKPPPAKPEVTAANEPTMLVTKLLFKEPPVIDTQLILNELKKTYPNVECGGENSVFSFFFFDLKITLADAIISPQCVIIRQGNGHEITLPQEAFQQNWHWQGAKDAMTGCNYEVDVSDMMATSLEYKTRYRLYMEFLTTVIRIVRPDVVYCFHAQKLMQPDRVVELWPVEGNGALDALVNVRLFNVAGSAEKELVMDTVGLHVFGLPDLQVRYTVEHPNAVATLLWNYAHYIFDKGDIIHDGNTVGGATEGSRWVCRHEGSLVAPARQVINITPQ